MTFERLRGFRDLYPEDAGPKFYVLKLAQDVARSFGFQHIDMPSLEPLDLYRLKSGDELVSQTFSFTDKGGREVTMIPEATPSVVRMLTARKDLPRPVKWFSLPKLWRYEEPQSGRLREHFQFNADIFGPNTPEADAEMIGLAAAILDRLGLEGKYSVRVNDRKLMESLLANLGAEKPLEVFSVIDKFRKISREEFRGQLTDLGLSTVSIGKIVSLMETTGTGSSLRETLEGITKPDDGLLEIITRMEFCLQLISAYTKSDVFIDFSVVRGLSYYTGIVFEVFDKQGEFRSVLGGGRYDNLSRLMSDQDIPAVGFGMGDVVLELLMKREGLWNVPDLPLRFYVCIASSEYRREALRISEELRKSGFISSVDISQRSLSAQLKNASISGFEYAVIMGRKEAESGMVTLRNLQSGTQQQVERAKLPEFAGKLQA